MALGAKRVAVQNPLVRYARHAGWPCLPRDDTLRLRRGEGNPLLYEVFVDQHQRLNSGVVDLGHAEEIARRLSPVRPTIEGNLEAWE